MKSCIKLYHAHYKASFNTLLLQLKENTVTICCINTHIENSAYVKYIIYSIL